MNREISVSVVETEKSTPHLAQPALAYAAGIYSRDEPLAEDL